MALDWACVGNDRIFYQALRETEQTAERLLPLAE